MYLREMLEKAVLKEQPEPEQDVVLVSSDSATWCDIPMVVPRVEWEDIYVRYRASEPDVEVVAMLLTRNSSRSFMAKFAEDEQVRQKYTQLRVAVDEAASVESDPHIMDGSVSHDNNGETEEEKKVYRGDMEGDFERSDLGSEFGVPSERGVYERPEQQEEDVPAMPLSAVATPTDMPEEKVSEPVRLAPEEDMVPAVEEPAPEESVHTEEEAGASCDMPAADEEPCAAVDMTSSDTGYVSEDMPEPEPVPVNTSSVKEEDEARQKQLVLYLQRFKETGVIDTDVAEWALSCTSLFSDMYNEFSLVFNDVSVEVVLQSSGYTAETFVREWAGMNWDENSDVDFVDLQTAEQFMALFKKSYEDCLKFLAYEEKDKAVQLAQLFAGLIYEE